MHYIMQYIYSIMNMTMSMNVIYHYQPSIYLSSHREQLRYWDITTRFVFLIDNGILTDLLGEWVESWISLSAMFDFIYDLIY